MDSKKHIWVKYSNPRNGRVQLSACARCGVGMDFATGALPCTGLSVSGHKMEKMGWTKVSDPETISSRLAG